MLFKSEKKSPMPCVGYPSRWARTIKVRESGLRRPFLLRSSGNRRSLIFCFQTNYAPLEG
jgi:hypothetical protein